MSKKTLCIFVVCAWCAVVQGGTAITLADGGRSDWIIVAGSGERDGIAASDLAEIFEKSTGVRLAVETNRPARAKYVLFVGNEFAADEAANLSVEETRVFEKGGNLHFIGGGVAGSGYAVMDFCEKYFGYRLYGTYEGAEIIRKTSRLAWDGNEISSRPVFSGFRCCYNKTKAANEREETFFRRNRMNLDDRPSTRRVMGAQHGFFHYVPPKDGGSWLLNPKWPGMWKTHPEYYSLGKDGKRTTQSQLCLSNPELRALFISRFREAAKAKGPGIYMVGCNDQGAERFCWCDGCAKLIEKYGCNGGPQWDFILELCKAVEDMPEVYVTSLAYKGIEQTELAPARVRFPDNFICDAAFLTIDRPVTLLPPLMTPDGRKISRARNLRAWRRAAKHVSWWYYGGSTPVETYRRMQIEFKELRDSGVESIGSCTTGGGLDFGDVSLYMFFRLARDPDIDADAVVMDIFRHRFGKAADVLFAYLRELESYNMAKWSDPSWAFGCDSGVDNVRLEAGDIVRWQKMFDRALELVEHDSLHARNVAIARLGLDCWTLVSAPRIKTEVPDSPLDISEVLSRGYAACNDAESRGIVEPKNNRSRGMLDSFRYYADLKSSAIPPELAGDDPAKVILYLPMEPIPALKTREPITNDVHAAAGVALFARGFKSGDKIGFENWDARTKEWLFARTASDKIDFDSVPTDSYKVYRAGLSRVPKSGRFVIGGKWGTSLDVRNLGRFYDPTYHQRRYEFFVSLRREGEVLFCDRIWLVDRGLP